MNIVPEFMRRRIEHRPNLLKIIDNIAWLFFDKIVRTGVALIAGIWIARYLGPERFGLLSFGIAFVGLVGAIASLGLHGVVVRDILGNPAIKEETLGTAAVLQFIGGLFAYVLIVGMSFWMLADDYLTRTLVVILGLSVLFKFSDVAVYWFESQVLSKYTVWVQNSCCLIFALSKIGLILNNAPLIGFAWVMIAEALVVASLMMILLRFRGLRWNQMQFRLTRAKRLLAESWPLLLSSIAIMVYLRIDQIMLGQLVGGTAVGIYSAAVKISEIWYVIPTAIAASVFPAILDAKNRSELEYYQRLQRLYNLMVWLSLGIALPMTFISNQLVILLFGESFSDSGTVLAIHAWTTVFVFLGTASGKAYLAEGRQILSLQRSLIGAIMNVALNYILIPRYGVIGAAWATVISFGVANLIFDYIQVETRKVFNMKMKAFNILSVIKVG